MRKSFLTAFLLLTTITNSTAREALTVSGQVKDAADGEALPGVVDDLTGTPCVADAAGIGILEFDPSNVEGCPIEGFLERFSKPVELTARCPPNRALRFDARRTPTSHGCPPGNPSADRYVSKVPFISSLTVLRNWS